VYPIDVYYESGVPMETPNGGSVEKTAPAPSDYITGTVKWFNADKGYGFIKLPGDGLDVFVHSNQLHKSAITRELHDGERVQFRVTKGPKGCYAVDISLVEA